MGCIRSATVREVDRDDPVRLAVNVTGSIIADRGITGEGHNEPVCDYGNSDQGMEFAQVQIRK